jgi:hypothetical protein
LKIISLGKEENDEQKQGHQKRNEKETAKNRKRKKGGETGKEKKSIVFLGGI